MASDGGVDVDMFHRINEGSKVFGGVQRLMNNGGLRMNIKVLYTRVVVLTVTYG